MHILMLNTLDSKHWILTTAILNMTESKDLCLTAFYRLKNNSESEKLTKELTVLPFVYSALLGA